MNRLYRIAHKRKVDNQVVRIPDIFDLETAEKHARSLNERYSLDYKYFVERVNLNSLSEQELITLVKQGRLTPEDVAYSLGPVVFESYFGDRQLAHSNA